MKGKRKNKKHGFQIGHDKFYRRNTDLSPELPNTSVHYVRLSKNQHELVCNQGPGVDTASLGGGFGLLRPKGFERSELEQASETTDKR